MNLCEPLESLEVRGLRRVSNGTNSSSMDADYALLCGAGYPARAQRARASKERPHKKSGASG